MKMNMKCVVLSAAVAMVVMSHAFAATYNTVEYSDSGDIVPGELTCQFIKAKTYADRYKIPLVVVWSNPGDGFCGAFEQECLGKESVRAWMKAKKCIFVFCLGKNTSDGSAAFSYTKCANGYPMCRVHWRNNLAGKTVDYKFIGQSGKMHSSLELTDLSIAEQFMKAVDMYLGDYTPANSSVSDSFEEFTVDDCTVVTEATSTFENGWYVVTGMVKTAAIEVRGEANLILADGACLEVDGGIRVEEDNMLDIYAQGAGTGRLIASGADGGAGIGTAERSETAEGRGNGGAGGIITINGGEVTATGNGGGAGIGGGNGGAGGIVTINGGMVTATGNGGEKAAGIGSGSKGVGGFVTINDGTVIAERIGGKVTINGGSVKAKSFETQPKNGAGKNVYCVSVKAEKLNVEKLNVVGLDGYGTKDVYPIDGRVYLYLPDGTHRFSIFDGSTTLRYCAIVKGRDITVEPLPSGGEVGFFVNGRDVGGDHDLTAGWSYDNEVLTLTQGRDYVLSGAALENEVQIKVETEGAKVILSNAVVFTEGRPALVVERDASLQMAGDTSYLMMTNGTSAVTVAAGATLTVDLTSDKDRLESMICVFDFDAANAIGGGGTVEVDGGTFFVWSDAPAFAKGTGISCGEGVVMKTGADPETATFADKADEVPCVLVAPVVTVSVAKDIPHVSNITVSNSVEQIKGEEIADAMIYRVMLGDDVFVGYTVEEGYASQVMNPLVYPVVEVENIAIDEMTIPIILPVSPDKPLGPFDTAEEAEEAKENAEFAPSEEVADKLGKDPDALEAYRKMFELNVVETKEGEWSVEPFLKPDEWTNVVLSAQEATRQIPLGDIAALGLGEVIADLKLTNCVPGFYYSLYDGETVTDIKPDVNTNNVNILCGPEAEVVIPIVPQPSPSAGFFTIGVLEGPFIPGEIETSTNLHAYPPRGRGDKSDIL